MQEPSDVCTISRLIRFFLMGCALSAALPAIAEEREDEGKTAGDESWQIEQRQRWFEETRGLRDVANAGALRSGAVRPCVSNVHNAIQRWPCSARAGRRLAPPR